MSNEIAGFFLSFTDEEMSDIRRRLELFGYTADGDGLKKLLIETLCNMEEDGDEDFESPTDRVIGTVTDYLEKNPEKVLMGIAALKGLGRLMGKKN